MISNAANTLPPIKMYQNYSQFSTRFSTLGENWLLDILHGIWTFKHNYGSPIKLLLRRTKIDFPHNSAMFKRFVMMAIWYQNSQSKIYFLKVCWKLRKVPSEINFPAFSLPPTALWDKEVICPFEQINSDIFWRLNFLLLKTPLAARKGISLEWC